MEHLEHKKSLESFVEVCREICRISGDGIVDMEVYAGILEGVEMEVTRNTGLLEIVSVEKDRMDKRHALAFMGQENPVATAFFGISFLFEMLWHGIDETGIGNMRDFYVMGGRFVAEIRLHVGIRKHDGETETCFMEREREFFEKFPFEWDGKTGAKLITDCAGNRTLLHSLLCGMFKTDHYDMEVSGGYIKGITVYATDVAYGGADCSVARSAEADAESLWKYAGKFLSVISTADTYPGILPAAASYAASVYYSMCVTAGVRNRFVSMYESLYVLPKPEGGCGIRIGREAAPADVLRHASRAIRTVSEKLERKYCILLTKGRFTPDGIRMELSFSGQLAYWADNRGGYRFDHIRTERDDGEYTVPVSCIDEICSVMRAEDCVSIRRAHVESTEHGFLISEMDALMDDLVQLAVDMTGGSAGQG